MRRKKSQVVISGATTVAIFGTLHSTAKEKPEKASQTLIGDKMCADCFFCSFCMSCRSCTNCRRSTGLTEAYGTEDVKMCTDSKKTEAYGNASASFCRLI